MGGTLAPWQNPTLQSMPQNNQVLPNVGTLKTGSQGYRTCEDETNLMRQRSVSGSAQIRGCGFVLSSRRSGISNHPPTGIPAVDAYWGL